MNKLSTEKLIKYAEEKILNLTDMINQSAFTNIKERLVEDRQLAQVGLDALRSSQKGDHVPVAYLIHEKAKPVRLSFQNLKGFVSQSDIEEHELWQEELFTAQQKPVVDPDTRRMDWLVSQNVAVRTPMPYGSHARFVAQCDSDDCEEYHTTLREQVDAAIEAAGGKVAE